MNVGAVNPGALALEMVRSAVAAGTAQQQLEGAVAVKALQTMKLEGQAAVDLVNASRVGNGNGEVGSLVDVFA